MRASDDYPWVEERRNGLLGSFCTSFYNSISSCLSLCCCCWFIQDCLPGLGHAGHYRSEPGSYAPLPYGPSFDHPRPTDPLVGPGPGPAPPHFGPPGGPPGVPGPLAGPPGEDPYMFEPPGPPVPPGPPHY